MSTILVSLKCYFELIDSIDALIGQQVQVQKGHSTWVLLDSHSSSQDKGMD